MPYTPDPFWARFARMANSAVDMLRNAEETRNAVGRLAAENLSLRMCIAADAIAKGEPLKTGPWDPTTGESDLAIAAHPRGVP
jgi:hypothetical protein